MNAFTMEKGSKLADVKPLPNEWLEMAEAIFNTINHMFIGAVCFYTFYVCWVNGFESLYTWHVFLCVLGYHVLMAQGIIAMYNRNGWSNSLQHTQRRRAHWVTQVVGCTCCLVGIALEICYRELNNKRHFSSPHSIVGLISLIFLVLTLINGLAALFAGELRKRIRPIYSKFSHYVTGSVCFTLGLVAIMLGYEKRIFKNNTTPEGLSALTAFTASVIVLSHFGVLKTVSQQVKSMLKW